MKTFFVSLSRFKHLLQVIWFNLRVEPVGYVDGLPVAARAPEALHTNIQVG